MSLSVLMGVGKVDYISQSRKNLNQGRFVTCNLASIPGLNTPALIYNCDAICLTSSCRRGIGLTFSLKDTELVFQRGS